MDNYEIATGKTVDEAVENACVKLGVSRENISYEVLEMPQKKLFGLKVIPAKVKVTLTEEFGKKFESKKKETKKVSDSKPKQQPKPEKEVKQEAKKPEKEVKQEPKKTEKTNNKQENTKKQPKKEPSKEVKEEKAVKEIAKKEKAEPAVKEEKAVAAAKNENPSEDCTKKEENQEKTKIIDPEVLEKKGSEAASYIREILVALGFDDAEVNYSQRDGMIVLQLSGSTLSDENIGSVVGRKGDNLDAMQYLASLVANRSEGSYVRVVLDIDGYRNKREESLKSYARKSARQAVRSGKSITLEPMNPYERRIVHSTVQTVNGATSKSIGTEPNRRVVISPTEGKVRREGRKDGRRGDRNRKQRTENVKNVEEKTMLSNDQPKNDTSAISLYGRIDLD